MKRKAFKILLIMAFMVVMFCAFSISSSAAQYEPDGTTSTQYEYDSSECNRTIVVNCVDQSGKLLKKVNIKTKHGEDDLCFVGIYNYDIVSFESDQGLLETCKLMWTSGGSHFACSIDIDYYFRTGLSKDTLNVTVVLTPFDEITIKEKHYKEYRIGTNGSIRNDTLADYTTGKVIYCGNYFSTSAKNYTGWTLNSEYSSGFSGYWSMSWIGDYENIASLNDCMEWDVIKRAQAITDEYPRFNKYHRDEDGTLGYIANRIVTIEYIYEVDWCVYKFNANGGSGAPGNVEWWYDHDATIPTGVPTRSGYTFLGWGTYSSDSTPDFQPGDAIKMRTSKTLYAIWDKYDYEFSISDLDVTLPDELFPNSTIQVSVRTDSWDERDPYNDIPVQLYYDGKLLRTEYVDFAAYGIAYVDFSLNVGGYTGAHTIEVRINWSQKGIEVDPDNNSVSTTINVISDSYDFTIEPVESNGQYRDGQEVITSYIVYNNSDRKVLPSANADAQFVVYFYCSNQKIILERQTWDNVVIPAGTSNLIYFKWAVPEGLAGNTIYCECSINSTGALKESNLSDNTTTYVTAIADKLNSQTVNPIYEAQAPAGFSKASTPTARNGSASWSVWEYVNGSFVKRSYGIRVTATSPSIAPGQTCETAYYSSGRWTMKSGYGVSIAFYDPTIEVLSGYSTPPANAYTNIQSIIATFPEFRYLTGSEEYRALEYYDGEWCYVENSSADGNERIHYIPIWLEDGQYIVSVTVTDVWTPAGVITTVKNSNVITISGNIFDDYYVGG